MERGGEGSGATLGRDALAYADTLFNLARYLTGNATDAEDLVCACVTVRSTPPSHRLG
jgi:DNA-directed RNA polymerase specialized sigma24 family protein